VTGVQEEEVAAARHAGNAGQKKKRKPSCAPGQDAAQPVRDGQTEANRRGNSSELTGQDGGEEE
jgi:hypothetical protein